MSKNLNRYSYINAKLKTRMDLMLSDDFFQNLAGRPNIYESMLMLKGTPYGKMESIYEQTGDLKMAEKELKKSEIRFYRELQPATDDLLSGFISGLLLKYDLEVFKDWLRLWFDRWIRKRDISEVLPYVLRQHIITDFQADALLECKNYKELTNHLSKSVYGDILSAYGENSSSLSSLYELEKMADKLYYRKILEYSANFPDGDRHLIDKITGMEIDFENMLLILRYSGAGSEIHLKNLIEGGRYVNSHRTLKSDSVLSALSSYGVMSSLFVNESGGKNARIKLTETMFRYIEKRESDKLLRGNPFTVGTLICYFMRKRRECHRLITILNARQYNIPAESIRGNP